VGPPAVQSWKTACSLTPACPASGEPYSARRWSNVRPPHSLIKAGSVSPHLYGSHRPPAPWEVVSSKEAATRVVRGCVGKDATARAVAQPITPPPRMTTDGVVEEEECDGFEAAARLGTRLTSAWRPTGEATSDGGQPLMRAGGGLGVEPAIFFFGKWKRE
jgi:hypothetical protein